jgi:selT/selW/selH-like putative selenoprotein
VEIKKKFAGADVRLMPSSGGRFEVTLDGVAIFEKSKMNRHAQPGEIVRILEAKTGA